MAPATPAIAAVAVLAFVSINWLANRSGELNEGGGPLDQGRRMPSRRPRPKASMSRTPSVTPSHTATPSVTRSVPPGAWKRMVYVRAVTGPDAVGWRGAVDDVPHTPGNPHLCVDPPPFGAQCTMHQRDALFACLALHRCEALTCPDQSPYVNPRPDLRTRGPVCQARSVASPGAWLAGAAMEAGHGMCAPGGCQSLFFTRLTRHDVLPRAAKRIDSGVLGEMLRHGRGGGAPPHPAGDADDGNSWLIAVPGDQPHAFYTSLGLGLGGTPLVAELRLDVDGPDEVSRDQRAPAWLLREGSPADAAFAAPQARRPARPAAAPGPVPAGSGAAAGGDSSTTAPLELELDGPAWLAMPPVVRVYAVPSLSGAFAPA